MIVCEGEASVVWVEVVVCQARLLRLGPELCESMPRISANPAQPQSPAPRDEAEVIVI